LPAVLHQYRYDKLRVAKAALDAGASIINDITALADEQMAQLAAEKQVPVVLMHMQGTPERCKLSLNKDVVAEVLAFLLERAKQAENSAYQRADFIDPASVSAKRSSITSSCLPISTNSLKRLSCLVGPSRKKFIGTLTGKTEPADAYSNRRHRRPVCCCRRINSSCPRYCRNAASC